MNGTQKIIKYAAIIFALLIILSVIGFIFNIIGYFIPNGKVDTKNFYEEYNDVKEIYIDSGVSKLIIKKGEIFSVKADNVLTNFESKLNDNVLKIKEKTNKLWYQKYNGVITITINENILDNLEINHGAGNLLVDGINANEFELEHGAGKVELNNVSFQKTSISGGAGEIIVNSSNLKNLDLYIGAGKTSIEAYIEGKSEINCGVGALDITLLGNEEDYQIKVSKGVGSIKINDDNQKNNQVFGNGHNTIELNGGVGSINVNFK